MTIKLEKKIKISHETLRTYVFLGSLVVLLLVLLFAARATNAQALEPLPYPQVFHTFMIENPDGSETELKGLSIHSVYNDTTDGQVFQYNLNACDYSDPNGRHCVTATSCDLEGWMAPYFPKDFNSSSAIYGLERYDPFPDNPSVERPDLRPLRLSASHYYFYNETFTDRYGDFFDYEPGNPRGNDNAYWTAEENSYWVSGDDPQFTILDNVTNDYHPYWGSVPDYPQDVSWRDGEVLYDSKGGNVAHGGVTWVLRLEEETGPICGDGIIQDGEECDGGICENGEMCTPTCNCPVVTEGPEDPTIVKEVVDVCSADETTSTLTYTITVDNSANDQEVTMTIVDTLDSDILAEADADGVSPYLVDSSLAANASFSGGEITWTDEVIAAGQTTSLTYEVIVPDDSFEVALDNSVELFYSDDLVTVVDQDSVTEVPDCETPEPPTEEPEGELPDTAISGSTVGTVVVGLGSLLLVATVVEIFTGFFSRKLNFGNFVREVDSTVFGNRKSFEEKSLDREKK